MAYVMIVDDDEDFAGAAATALESDKHEVRVVIDTDAALAEMHERRPDLVVLDVMFPENSSAGFELARKTHLEHEVLKGVPILLLTAVNARFALGFSSRDIDETWMPVTEFLEKPVDLGDLREKVAALLAREPGEAGRAPQKAAE